MPENAVMHGNRHEASSGIPDTALPLALPSPREGHAAPRPAHSCGTASVGKANWCLGIHCHLAIICHCFLLRKTYRRLCSGLESLVLARISKGTRRLSKYYIILVVIYILLCGTDSHVLQAAVCLCLLKYIFRQRTI